MSLSEMARSADLPLSTTHRLVGVLTRWGALERRDGGDYSIGQHLWELGLLADVQVELKQVSAPFLQDLYAATRETIYLAVRVDTRALYVDRLTGVVRPSIMAEIGSYLPLHATGVGKVLLAHAPSDVIERVLGDLRSVTPHTMTDRVRLRAQLAACRERGFARTSQEMGMGTASVAVPIRVGGKVLGAIGLVTADLTRDLSRLVPALQVVANGVARQCEAVSLTTPP